MRQQSFQKALSKMTETGFRLFFVASLLFAGLTACYNRWLCLAELVLVLILYLYFQTGITRRKKEVMVYLDHMTSGVDAASRRTMITSPLPIVIFRPDTDDIIWSNERFLHLTGDPDHLFETKLSALVPSFQSQWLLDGDHLAPEPIPVGEKQYLVYGNLVCTGDEDAFLATTYWVDVTEYAGIADRFHTTRPVVGILQVDNYEDLIRGLEEGERSAIRTEINHRLVQWLEPSGAILLRYERDHYLLIWETGPFRDSYRKKFPILDEIRQVQSPNGVAATLSMGFGCQGQTPRELHSFASLALDMALSRGGDQAVVKDGPEFFFFGGRSKEVERRTKVKSRVVASALSELLASTDQVIVMGHAYPDLDVVGAVAGVCAIARKKGVPIRAVRAPSPYPAEEQVRQLEQHITDIDYDTARRREKEVRHDVMAHVYTYGKAAPQAAGIIHLGATSCYVTDNADLILYRDGLVYLRGQLLAVMKNLSAFAEKYAATPTLGYTHYQPAQPVTVGKRAALWLQDLLSDLEELDFVLGSLRFLGCRGTTGTEASFMDLFDGDEAKIDEMNRRIAAEFGFDACFTVCGQTYPRKVDARILNCLSSMAQSVYRMANDIRLLQHDRQLEEPFEEHQIGSSAMAYKRNPMRCERICSLSRYLMADAMNASMTASVQWMERTLDDSANRRLSMPEGFLCADAILRLAQNVTDGLRVNEKVVDKTIREYMPFLATENLMMEAVKRGGDRQQLHERVRVHSMAATARMKDGEPCDLLDRLAGDPAFGMTRPELDRLMDPARYIGRCPQQVRALLDRIAPLLEGASSADGGVSL